MTHEHVTAVRLRASQRRRVHLFVAFSYFPEPSLYRHQLERFTSSLFICFVTNIGQHTILKGTGTGTSLVLIGKKILSMPNAKKPFTPLIRS